MNRIRLAAALTVLALTPAAAQSQTITACYVPKTGSVYRIQAAGAPDACKTNHVEFSWDAGGSAWGAPQEIMVPSDIQPGETNIITAVCPAGTTPIAGGFRIIPPATSVAILASTKSVVPVGWFLMARNDGSDPAEVAVHAFCVDLTP